MGLTENGLKNKVRIVLTKSCNLFPSIIVTKKFRHPFTTIQLSSGWIQLNVNGPTLKQPEAGMQMRPLHQERGRCSYYWKRYCCRCPSKGGIRFHQSAQLPFNFESTTIADSRFPVKGNYLLLFLCLCIFMSLYTFRCCSGLQEYMLLLCFSLMIYDILNTAIHSNAVLT